MQFLDRGLGDPEKIGHLGQRKLPQALLGIRGILLLTQDIEPIRNQFSLLENDFIEGQIVCILLEWYFVHPAASPNIAFIAISFVKL